MPIGKQTKDSYPNKLTGCQKKTKNPLFYVVGERGGTKQNKKKTQKNKSEIKSSTVSILSLETAVNHEGRHSLRIRASVPFVPSLRQTCWLAHSGPQWYLQWAQLPRPQAGIRLPEASQLTLFPSLIVFTFFFYLKQATLYH